MTHRTIPVMSVQECITRPIALGVLTDLSKYINLNWLMEGTDIHFSINGAGTPLPNSRLHEHSHKIRLPADVRISLTLDEEPTDSASMTKLGSETTQYIFADEEQRIYIKPIYTAIKARLGLEVTGKSREQVMFLYRELTAKLYSPLSVYMHEAEYHYYVPNYVMQLLIEVNDTMRAADPTADRLKDYFNKHFTKTLTVMGDVAAGRNQFAVKEKGILINGRFTHNASIPKPEVDEELGIWKINLEYEYYYDRLDLIYLQHPISIYQTLLPDRFLNIDERMTPDTIIGQSSEFADSVGSWKYTRHGTMNEDWYFKQPYMDSWNVEYKPSDFDPIISYLLGTDGQIGDHVGNLSDVEFFEFRDYLINYVTAVHARLNVFGGALVRLHLYSGYNVMSNESYEVDSDLNIVSKTELPLVEQYHGVLGLVNTLKGLSFDARLELTQHGRFFKNWIMIYMPWLLPKFDDLDVDDLDPGDVMDIITAGDDPSAIGNTGRVPLVNRLKLFYDLRS